MVGRLQREGNRFRECTDIRNTTLFVEGRVGTPQTVNLARVRLPSGEAVSAFTSNIHLMGAKLQPFMDFALGEGAEVSDRFRFRDIGVQVAGSEQVGSSYHRCLAACKEMTRLVLLANFKSLRLLEDEVVILPCLPGAAPNSESAAPEPSASPAAGGAPLGNVVSGPTERAPASQADDQETTHEEGARNRCGAQAWGGSTQNGSGREWTR